MDHPELIDRLGGTSAVAGLLRVKPPSVSEWKRASRIPDDKLIRIAPIAEARGVATRKELFPSDWADIWPELASRTKDLRPDEECSSRAANAQVGSHAPA